MYNADIEKTQAPGGCSDPRLDQERKSRFADRETCGQTARSMSSEEGLAELFKYHPPTPVTIPKFAAINQAAKNFAEVVLANCPHGADRVTAINCIRNARMFANAAISLNGLTLY